MGKNTPGVPFLLLLVTGVTSSLQGAGKLTSFAPQHSSQQGLGGTGRGGSSQQPVI